MIYANTNIGKAQAERGLSGTCPNCGGIVIPKCGEINIHHWAHKSITECDTWSEGETDWHRKWKAYFPPEYTEVSLTKDGIRHRADVRLSTGKVLEFQHSGISPADIAARNAFWENVLWIFDVQKDDLYWERRLHTEGVKPYSGNDLYKDEFTWRRPRRSLGGLSFYVLDSNNGSVLWVDQIYANGHGAHGLGRVHNKFSFLVDVLDIEKEWASTGIIKKFDPRNFTW